MTVAAVFRVRRPRFAAAIAAICIAVTITPLHAAGLRCGNDLVRPGDSVLAVADSCGEPDRRAAIVGEDNHRIGTAYYYRQENKAARKVYFRGGEVTRIERLD
jgi:hypothetical protein